jgi:hypothetical protein
MKNASRARRLLFTALLASFLSGCVQVEGNAKRAGEIQSDKESLRGSYGLIHLRESPAFPVDEKKRPFAMIDDRTDRARASEKPIRIEESKLRQ